MEIVSAQKHSSQKLFQKENNMAYLLFSVGGNPDFGGYLSVDGEPSILMQDDVVCELQSGLHAFKIHSTSDDQRAAGKRAKNLSNLFGDGGALDSISRAQAKNAIGREWSFQGRVGDDEVMIIEVVSEGMDIISTPEYRVTEVDEETRARWESIFEEQRRLAAEEEEKRKAEEAEKERKREEARKLPRKSIPKIIVGGVVSFYGVIFTAIMATSVGGVGIVAGLAALGVGAFLLFDGLRKKIRK